MKILETSRPTHSLLDHSVAEVITRLQDILDRTQIREAWLFGSLARGEIHAWSDIDLLLVVDTDLPFVKRPLLFAPLFDNLPYAVDLLVYTPEEFRNLQESDSGFWRCFNQDKVRVR